MSGTHRAPEGAHEVEIAIPPDTNIKSSGLQVEFEFEDTVGVVMLGLVTLALLITLLAVIRQNRALVNQLRER